ncbi:unnamed protein product [Trifolium pratense]|uniref:Uncharacterized protein n=1 Tax=Trifolium pratense TaxID=57577 RepID=A0ACB0KNL8_TRIPR|nr:unnamed protein product [Trifolium pratense]
MKRICGSRDDDINNDERRSPYNRLTTAQTARLENFMKECNHPNEAQQQQLAEELGLQPKQVKYWFQNKRTLLKNQHEKQHNNNLRLENERLRNENLLMKEALKATKCEPCGGPPFPKEEHQHYMHKMQQENAELKKEFENVSKVSKSFMENNELDNSPMVYQTSSHLHHLSNLIMREDMSVNRSTQCYDEEKTMMLQIATLAMQELERLVRVNEPFWINFSNTHQDERYTLDHERYCQFFPKNNHIRGDNVSKESSKYSGIIGLDGMQLVDMFLDSDKWRDLFPTIVTKVETTKVLEIGLPGNRDGALLLMNEEMHILSPLVRPREFNIIRYCKQVDVDVWVITDVSFDSSRPNTPPLSHSWKHPSGCIIREMPNKSCLVTWVEHVEVEDMLHTHHIFRDFVVNNTLYGAESWIKELQRMCERFFSFYAETIPAGESIGVIQTIEGRRSVMKLADRMVKIFCECLRMAGQLEFQHLNIESIIGGVRVSLRQVTDIGQGIIVAAATTLCLPLPAEYVFDFLKDPTKRYQWDVMAYENPMYEIGHVSNGLYPGNCTTIFQPYNPSENSTMILQESFTSPVGSYVIYAPIDTISMNAVMCGEDSTKLPIIPTGFVVCPYAQPNATFEASNNIGSSSSSGGVGRGGAGTLLTLTYQILTCNPNGIDQHQNMEAFATMNTLLTTSVLKVRGALMNSY